MQGLPAADPALARRIEAAEAAHAALLARSPGCEALPVMGGQALFAGVGSPATHALGIGVYGPVTAAEFDTMEEFFRERGSASLIDLCPLCDLTVIEQVRRRGYRVIEFNHVLARRVISGETFRWPQNVSLGGVDTEEEAEIWRDVLARGFANSDDPPEELRRVTACFPASGRKILAWLDGVPAGGAAAAVVDGTAFFYGATTLVAARRRGVQPALLQARLMYAAQQGADLAVVCVLPGSSSHRNCERLGFELIYTRTNLIREWE
jgi:GNAT superfamily N-acetyltransferase